MSEISTAPADAPGFIVAQLVGSAAATALFRWLVPALPQTAGRVVDRAPELKSSALTQTD